MEQRKVKKPPKKIKWWKRIRMPSVKPRIPTPQGKLRGAISSFRRRNKMK